MRRFWESSGVLKGAFFFLLVLAFVGCGSSRGDWVSTFSGSSGEPSPLSGQTATVQLRSVLAQAAVSSVPSQVDSLRVCGFDSEQTLIYGPLTRPKAALIELSEVPVEVSELVFEYLAAGRIVGLAQVSVSLRAGETLVIDNPAILGVSATLERLTLTPATVTVAKGTSASFVARGFFSDGSSLDLSSSVSWSTSESGIADFESGPGIARALAVGETTVRAAFAGLSAEARLTVSGADLVSLLVSPGAPAIALGTSQDFKVEGLFSDGSFQDLTEEVSWSSESTSVAEIADPALVLDGVDEFALRVEGIGIGQSRITASLDSVSGSATLTVTSAELLGLSITEDSLLGSTSQTSPLAAGTRKRLVLAGSFSDGSSQDLTSSATWNSSDSDVAELESPGIFLAKAPGPTQISASFGGLDSGNFTLTVSPAVITSITLSPLPADSDSTVAVGGSLNLQAVAGLSDGGTQPLNADELSWSSGSETKATVNAQGQVSGVELGQSLISASFPASGAPTVTGSLTVTVIQAPVVPLPSLVILGGSFDADTGEYTGDYTLDGGSQVTVENETLPGWDPDEEHLHLSSFSIADGITLNVTGSALFQVKAVEEITIHGTLDRRGADGANQQHGTNGSKGGDIRLLSDGPITVSDNGHIDVSGGKGGNGGGSDNVSGGNGGDGGSVSLLSQGELFIEGEISAQGGDGGDATATATAFAFAYTNYSGSDKSNGGQGGRVSLLSQGELSVSGEISAQGGDGGDATATATANSFYAFANETGQDQSNGGQGGSVSLISQGTLTVSGQILAQGGNGGDATATATADLGAFANFDGSNKSNGGQGGSVSLISQGTLTVSGQILAQGGNGGDATAIGMFSPHNALANFGGSNKSNGGQGGVIVLPVGSSGLVDASSVAGGAAGVATENGSTVAPDTTNNKGIVGEPGTIWP